MGLAAKKLATCIAVWTGFAGFAVAQQDFGTISGIVLDDTGKPVADVRVEIDDVNFKGARFGPLQGRDTDLMGNFVIPGVKWGTYAVYPRKESAGYPSPELGFYPGEKSRQVTVSPSGSDPSLTLVLGPKAGRIERIQVTDAVNHEALAGASVSLYRGGVGGLYTGADNPSLLVPARQPFSIKISSPGYEDWYYPGVRKLSESAEIFPEPDEKLELNVSLQPLRPPL